MFKGGNPNYQKLRTNLRVSINRLKLLEKKKSELALKARKEIADYIGMGKEDRARIRVEHIVREDYLVEGMEIIEMYCDLLLTRFGLIQKMKELDPGLEEAIATIIWASPRLMADCQELKVISDQLTIKYGKEFAAQCKTNGLNNVNDKVMHKLSINAPPRRLIECYMEEIAKAYNVPFEPANLDDEEPAVATDLIDFVDDEKKGGPPSGGGGRGGGGMNYPAMPNAPYPTSPSGFGPEIPGAAFQGQQPLVPQPMPPHATPPQKPPRRMSPPPSYVEQPQPGSTFPPGMMGPGGHPPLPSVPPAGYPGGGGGMPGSVPPGSVPPGSVPPGQYPQFPSVPGAQDQTPSLPPYNAVVGASSQPSPGGSTGAPQEGPTGGVQVMPPCPPSSNHYIPPGPADSNQGLQPGGGSGVVRATTPDISSWPSPPGAPGGSEVPYSGSQSSSGSGQQGPPGTTQNGPTPPSNRTNPAPPGEPDLNFPEIPNLPDVPSNSGGKTTTDDIDFDDLSRRFENLKKKK